MSRSPRLAAEKVATRSVLLRPGRSSASIARLLLGLATAATIFSIALFVHQAESAIYQQPQQDPFTLAGRVVTTFGAPVAGVTITFTRVLGEGAIPAAAQTDAGGNWSQTGFRAGTVYRVTPSRAGMVFNPATRDAANTIADLGFQATFDPFAAGGRVITTFGAPVAGVTLNFSRVSGNGELPAPAQTGANGDWSRTGFRAGTTYRVTPSRSDLVFIPPSHDFNGPVGDINFQSLMEPFSVSGRVINPAGGAIAGATITFTLVTGSGDVPAPVQSDNDGNWGQNGFRTGSVYRITPSRAGLDFIPPSFDVRGTITDVKFIGAPGTAPPPPTDGRPLLTITSPPNGSIINTPILTVRGTVNPANAQVTVNGVAATVSNGQFVADNVTLPREGVNLITAIGTAANGTSQAGITVSLDLTPPTVIIDSPPSGFVTPDETIAVAGMVSDVITPNPAVRVNGVDAQVNNGAFIAMGVRLNPGQNRITASARDSIGNVGTATISVTRAAQPGLRLLIETGQAQSGPINSALPTPLGVRLVDGDGAAVANRELLFQVARGDGVLRNSPPQPNQTGARNLALRTDASGRATALFTLGSRTGAGANRVQVTIAGGLSFVEFCATAASGAPNRITIIPMSDQQTGEVNRPLADSFTAVVSDAQGNGVAGVAVSFRVTEGGGNLNGAQSQTVNTDAQGFARALLTLGPNPGTLNNAVAASFQGQTDPPAVFSASARVPGPPANTSFTGLVLDNGDRPLRNARALILGSNRSAFTDAQGRFTITNVPPGAQRLFIEGEPIIDSLGRIFPDLEFDVNVISGVPNSLTTPIYLPPLAVDPQSVVMIRGPVTSQIVLRMPGVPEGTLTLLPGTVVRNANGPASDSNPITVRLSRVNNDRVPMPPPNGSLFMLAGTVQPAGVLFDPPAAICVPNAGMPPGAQVDIFSFDHDVGQFLSIGMATVSEDGSVLCSNPGFGIRKAGWWGCSPPRPPTTDPRNCRVMIVSANIAEDSIRTQLSPNGCTGAFTLELIGAQGNVTLVSAERGADTYDDSFNIRGLPEQTFTQVRATWVIAGNQRSQTVQSRFNHAFQNLGQYRHSQYNTPDESDSSCGGSAVNVCFNIRSTFPPPDFRRMCTYEQGTMASIFKRQVDLNGSGRSVGHGNVQPEGDCSNPPGALCQGRSVYRANTTIRPSCSGGTLGNNTVAVGDGGPVACGDRIVLIGLGRTRGGTVKTATDRCPACTGRRQIDNYTTDGRCTGVPDLGNFITIKLLD